jgi:hypothetical protein
VSGGCDSLVKIWKEGDDGHWTEESKLDAHSDWVRKNFCFTLLLITLGQKVKEKKKAIKTLGS